MVAIGIGQRHDAEALDRVWKLAPFTMSQTKCEAVAALPPLPQTKIVRPFSRASTEHLDRFGDPVEIDRIERAQAEGLCRALGRKRRDVRMLMNRLLCKRGHRSIGSIDNIRVIQCLDWEKTVN